MPHLRPVQITRRSTGFVLVLVCCALGLLTGSARGALAGANPLTSTLRPDLRSATLDGNQVRFCFDKRLGRGPYLDTPASRSLLRLAGYRSPTASAPPQSLSFDGANPSCLLAQYDGSADDLGQYTTAQAGEGVVQAGSGATNRADSVALTGSSAQTGARGRTAGPDLLGVILDASSNRLYFVFDQLVTSGGVHAAHFYTADGTVRDSVGPGVAAGNVVGYDFTASVRDAVRAFVDEGQLYSRQSAPLANPLASAALPGTSGTTARPDLLSATLSPDGTYIDYAYDQPIAGPDPRLFTAVRSDGVVSVGSSATVLGRTVRVYFPSTAYAREYLVWASASTGAVQDGDVFAPIPDSTAGGVPLGGNAGASAAGYTTGPDALSVTFAPASGDAAVTFDQRFRVVSSAGFVLLDASGSRIGGAPSAAVTSGGSPGETTVRLHYSPTDLAGARALEIRGYLPGDGGSATVAAPGGGNLQQILSPVPTASVLRYGASGRTATLRKGVRVARLAPPSAAARSRRVSR